MTDRSALHWFPVFVSDWLTSDDITLMLPEQEGGFFRLLLRAWGKGDAEPSLPTDDATLAVFSRLGTRWKKLGGLVRAQFEERDGKLYNVKLSEVWNEQQHKHGKAVERGGKGGRTRAANRKNSSSSATANLNQSELESEEELEASAPHGAEKLLASSAPDGGLAPAGAAPPAPGEPERSGDYLDRPSTREALFRAGVRPGDVRDRPRHPAPIHELEAEHDERATQYDGLLLELSGAWIETHPVEAKAIGAVQRAALGLPVTGNIPDTKISLLRACVVEAIRKQEGWAKLDQWDGSETLASYAHPPAGAA